jgi:hypothetical protein
VMARETQQESTEEVSNPEGLAGEIAENIDLERTSPFELFDEIEPSEGLSAEDTVSEKVTENNDTDELASLPHNSPGEASHNEYAENIGIDWKGNMDEEVERGMDEALFNPLTVSVEESLIPSTIEELVEASPDIGTKMEEYTGEIAEELSSQELVDPRVLEQNWRGTSHGESSPYTHPEKAYGDAATIEMALDSSDPEQIAEEKFGEYDETKSAEPSSGDQDITGYHEVTEDRALIAKASPEKVAPLPGRFDGRNYSKPDYSNIQCLLICLVKVLILKKFRSSLRPVPHWMPYSYLNPSSITYLKNGQLKLNKKLR